MRKKKERKATKDGAGRSETPSLTGSLSLARSSINFHSISMLCKQAHTSLGTQSSIYLTYVVYCAMLDGTSEEFCNDSPLSVT